MAYVKVGSHSSATACLTYGEYKDKELRDGVVVGGVDCRPSAAKEEFKAVRFLWNKENGVQAHTVIQSFDDDITMDKANEIGQDDYCAVKAPGLNGNSATILPFSPSHSIVERQLNAI